MIPYDELGQKKSVGVILTACESSEMREGCPCCPPRGEPLPSASAPGPASAAALSWETVSRYSSSASSTSTAASVSTTRGGECLRF